MKLTEYEWNILDELQDQDEPFEIIDGSLQERFRDSRPRDLLEAVYKLYKLGFVSMKQAPIKALGQSFKAREIRPKDAIECLGDLKADYDEYFKSRDAPAGQAGGMKEEQEASIPIGIWIDITEAGQDEYDSDDYMGFWPNSPSEESAET